MHSVHSRFYGAAHHSYLCAVTPARVAAELRGRALVAELRGRLPILMALLGYASSCERLSHEIERSLSIAAMRCDPLFPALAVDLRAAAALEHRRRAALVDDLRELNDWLPERDGTSTSAPIDQHLAARAQVTTHVDPWAAIIVEIELGERARAFESALYDACRASLAPTIDGCRFLRKRVVDVDADADPWITIRGARLGAILQRFGDRVGLWIADANAVTESYLDAVHELVERRRMPTSHSPPRAVTPAWCRCSACAEAP